jgi:hypothetical protein
VKGLKSLFENADFRSSVESTPKTNDWYEKKVDPAIMPKSGGDAIAFTEQKLSSHGGISTLWRFLRRSGFNLAAHTCHAKRIRPDGVVALLVTDCRLATS